MRGMPLTKSFRTYILAKLIGFMPYFTRSKVMSPIAVIGMKGHNNLSKHITTPYKNLSTYKITYRKPFMDNQDAVEVTCNDNGKKVIGYILNYRAKDQLEISLNTVKIRMQYKSGIFVGSMAGMEFVVQEDTLPRQFKDFQR
jgi:hypothetical protein